MSRGTVDRFNQSFAQGVVFICGYRRSVAGKGTVTVTVIVAENQIPRAAATVGADVSGGGISKAPSGAGLDHELKLVRGRRVIVGLCDTRSSPRTPVANAIVSVLHRAVIAGRRGQPIIGVIDECLAPARAQFIANRSNVVCPVITESKILDGTSRGTGDDIREPIILIVNMRANEAVAVRKAGDGTE